MKTLKSDVASSKFFTELGYSTCWEDPEVLKIALSVTERDTVLSVTSGGDLTIGLLLENPRQIVSIDLNAIQNYLLELKLACFRVLDYPDMLAFLGIRPSTKRLRLFETLRPHLSPSALNYWSEHPTLVENGCLHQGKQDCYFFNFSRLLCLLLGRKKIETLLKLKDLSAQKRFFDGEWNSRRWRWIFDLFFSRTVMSLFMDSAHFRLVKNLRFGPLIRKQVDDVLRDHPIWENYFVHWVMTRSYPGGNCMPPYLREENFETIRSRVDRISIVTEEIETFLAWQRSGSFSKFNLSNIFDWIDDNVFIVLLQEIDRVAGPNSRLCYYNLLRRRVVPGTFNSFTRYGELAEHLLKHNRAMGYTNFELYAVHPTSLDPRSLEGYTNECLLECGQH
jgi:S-adenosylmethionine-diacylglycerol 3-amino-3-carboxypropyl transferase